MSGILFSGVSHRSKQNCVKVVLNYLSRDAHSQLKFSNMPSKLYAFFLSIELIEFRFIYMVCGVYHQDFCS